MSMNNPFILAFMPKCVVRKLSLLFLHQIRFEWVHQVRFKMFVIDISSVLYHALYHATVRQDGKVNDDENNSEMLMGEIKADNIRKYLKLVHNVKQINTA